MYTHVDHTHSLTHLVTTNLCEAPDLLVQNLESPHPQPIMFFVWRFWAYFYFEWALQKIFVIITNIMCACLLMGFFWCVLLGLQLTLKNQKSADNTIRWVMSRFANCGRLNSLYDGPVRLVLRRSEYEILFKMVDFTLMIYFWGSGYWFQKLAVLWLFWVYS